jgi:acetyl-CoA C-acetyltransferase
MTKFMRRAQETGKELAWEAAKMALDSCEMKLGDIDDVVLGTAPDAFDMIHMKSEYLTDGCGGWHKPYVRGYVGGGTGVFIANQGWYHVASGLFDTCLVVAEEKMSSLRPHPQGAFITIWDQFTESPLGPSLLWYFAMEMNRYMDRYGFTERDMALSAVKNKRNAMGHPCAQLPMELTVDDVVNSEVMAWPVKRLDVSPTSDGAVALVLAAEHVAKRISDKPVWIEGVGWNLETFYVGQRDLYYPKQVEFAARQAYQMAGIKEPDKEIDVVEPYDPFDYKEFQHLEALLLCGKGEAPKLMADGVFNRDGRLPSCPSGGALGVGNAIAATGTMKVAELFWQLRGEAGKRQVPGKPRKGLAQAWGDEMQVGTVTILGI